MNNPYFNLVRSVWQNGRPWRWIIVCYYCAYIIAQGSLGLCPYAFGQAINILQHFTSALLYEVIVWLSMGVLLLLAFWLFHGPARIKEREVALKIQQAFRIHLYEQLTQLPFKWHQNHHSGNTITRISRASMALYRFAGGQYIYIETIIKLLVSIGFLFWISIPVGLLSLIVCILNACIVLLFDRKLIPLYDAQNEIDNYIGATFFDYVSNFTTILTLRLGDLTRNHLLQRMMTVWPFFRKDIVLTEVKWFSMGILLAMTQLAILIGYIVYHSHIANGIMIGSVVMIFHYQWDLNQVFYNLSEHYSELVHMDTDIKGLQPILGDLRRFAHEPQGTTLAHQWHTFTIKNLVFHHTYDARREKIFNQLGFTVKRGEKIALIGASGSGKSTLLNLLCGIYVANHVELTIDGTTFDSLEPLQTITTLIPQDPEIFENTIAFNITMDVSATSDAIDRAIQLAGFSTVLATLPAGLNTDIREKGVNFSVGQKQRLALARGLFAARFSSIILMDEPTSSIDLLTEKAILSGVIGEFPDAAMIVSLHRLHLLPKFDRIIMLKDGIIVANGLTHDLLNYPGTVYDLWHTYQEH